MPADDKQREHQVAEGHHGHDNAADLGDAVDTAENDHQRQKRQDNAHYRRVETEGHVEGAADGVALDGIVRQAESQGNQNGEEGGEPGLLEAFQDIIGRAADERMVAPLLEELCEGRFHEGRGRSEQGDEPHPEHGTRTADGDGGGHTGQVARTHACSDRHGESLE